MSYPCQYLHLSRRGAFMQALERLGVADKLECIPDNVTQLADFCVTLDALGGSLSHRISRQLINPLAENTHFGDVRYKFKNQCGIWLNLC